MVNVYHVNLEYLQQIDRSQATLAIVERTIEAQLQKLSFLPLESRNNTLVLGWIVWENTNLSSTDATSILLLIKDKINKLGAKFHLIAGINYKSQLSDIQCDVTFINFFALRTHLACAQQQVNTSWKFKNKKILFLMGKAYRTHRIGLLYQMYKHGLLNEERSTWSCQKLDFDLSREFLPRTLTDDDVKKFLNVCYREADSASIVIRDNGITHYGGFPFDENLYKTTNVSLISETLFSGPAFVTEKTYRAIVNHHPFVVASACGQNNELQQQGFFTFDEFMTHPQYNSSTKRVQSLDEIIENIKNFDPVGPDIERINTMIEHNAVQFDQLVRGESVKLQNMLEFYGASQSWKDILPWQDSSHYFLTWQFYYQTVKGPSWPHCESVEDCNKLPQQIQDELRNVFKVNF